MTSWRRIVQLAAAGHSWRAIEKQLHCSRATIARALKANGAMPWAEAEQKAAKAALKQEIALARAEAATAPLYRYR